MNWLTQQQVLVLHGLIHQLRKWELKRDFLWFVYLPCGTGFSGQEKTWWKVLRSQGPTEKSHSQQKRGNVPITYEVVVSIQKTFTLAMILHFLFFIHQQKHIMAERNVLLKNVKHPFLVGLHYSFQTADKLYFVLDFINGGEVSNFSFG